MCSNAQTDSSDCRMLKAQGREWGPHMWNKPEGDEKVDQAVIDLDRAQRYLGEGWINTYLQELQLAEDLYRYIDWVNLFLGFHEGQRLLKPRQHVRTDLPSN
jgi:hypothetical protein